jgi:uncharacterized protein (DUF1330 family)
MPAYMIARATIKDREKFNSEFMPLIKNIGQTYNAKLLAQSDNVQTLVGNDTIAHAAILEFPDLAKAQACAQSSVFQEAMGVAENCIADHYLRLIDGLPVTAGASAAVKEPAE